jgi:hypothetical protein
VTGAHILQHWKGEGAVSRIDVEIQPFVDASGKTGTLAVRFAIRWRASDDGIGRHRARGVHGK